MATEILTKQEAAAKLVRYVDPVRFIYEMTGEQMYEKQALIARTIATRPRVAVAGCNTSGKDWLTGRLVLWWLSVHRPAIAVILGPTHRQVEQIVWRNTRAAFRRAAERDHNLGGRMNQTPNWSISEDSFAIGFATDDPDFIQGFHSPNLLVIVTEAHAVPDDQIDAAERLSPSRIVMTGNPFSLSGKFFSAFHSQRDRWDAFNISAYDTPNIRAGRVVVPGLVTPDDIEGRRADPGIGSPLYVAGVLGEFPETLQESIVPLTWSKFAVDNVLPASEPNVLGVDVARYGDDYSVVCLRRGRVARWLWRGQGLATTELAARIANFCQSAPWDGTIVIDGVGPGGGVVDTLKDHHGGSVHGWRIREFQGGGRPFDQKRYVNRVAEAWGLMAEAFRTREIDIGVQQDGDPRMLDAAIGQMAARRFLYQGDQKIKLQSKDDIKKAGMRSPDEADALAMTFDPGARGGVGNADLDNPQQSSFMPRGTIRVNEFEGGLTTVSRFRNR